MREKASVEVGRCSESELWEVKRILDEAREAAMWSERALRESLADVGGLFLVARVAGEIVGFIVGRCIADEGEILNLAVKRERRREGVGRALALGLLTRFDAAEVRRVFLEVRESNQEAIQFYRGMGFQEVARRPGYYRESAEAALVMAKQTHRER